MTRLYLQLNGPGSGSARINRNDLGATEFDFDKWIRIMYRGEDRGGFFIDNIKEIDVEQGDEGAADIEISGRGALGILDNIIVEYENQGETTVTYVAKKIGYIMADLLTKGQARGVYPNLIWDFTQTKDSDDELWTVDHDLNFRVGSTLLEALDQFADLGVDWVMTFDPTPNHYILSAFKDGIGSNKVADVVFSPGNSTQKAAKLREGTGIKNAQLIEVADPISGPKFVWDTRAGSIVDHGRRESYFQAGTAATITEGLLLAAAELDERSNPRAQYTLVVTDANGPTVFEDYDIGDIVGYLNSQGEIDEVQVIGLQLDFTKPEFYATVTVELGVVIIDQEIESALKLRKLGPGITGGGAGGPTDPAIVAGALIGIHNVDVTAHTPYLQNANKIQGFDIVDPGIDTPVDNDLLQYNTLDAEWKYVSFAEAAFDHGELTGLGDDDHTQYLLIDGTRAMTGELDMDDNSIANVNYIDFDLVNGVAPAEGRAVWNDTDGTLNLGLKGGNVNLQIGQETVLRGKNTTGTGTVDGKPARISGASGSNPEFDFSEADDPASAGAIGLFTEDINNNASGYVTTGGLVRDLDTSGTPVGEVWAAADRIYVGNTAGELTNVSPTSTERIIFIGIVMRAHATEGVIWVNPINVSYLSELSGVTITAVADNELLAYDSGSGLWINQTPTEAGLDARYVEVAGDTMTGQLFIDGGADEIQLIVQANVTQTNNIVEIQKSDTTVLAGFDERGILFSDGGIDVNSVFVGNNSGNISASGAVDNIGVGNNALAALTSGDQNIAIGSLTLDSLTTGSGNVAIGWGSMASSVTGTQNVAVGRGTLLNSTGNDNMAIGFNALNATTTGSANMAIGSNAMSLNTEGTQNTAVGSLALQGNLTSNANVAVGYSALKVSTGATNTALGFSAGIALTSGAGNVFIGHNSASKQTTNSNLLIIDNQARADVATELTNSILYGVMAASPTSQTLRINAAVTIPDSLLVDGSSDEIQLTVQANAAQTENIFENQLSDTTTVSGFDERGILFSDGGIDVSSVYIGLAAGNIGHTNAILNVGIGLLALSSLTTGDDNVAVGGEAGQSLTTGSGNMVIGALAGFSLVGATSNVLIGFRAGRFIIGNNNVAIGREALTGTVTALIGQGNVAIGHQTGGNITGGDFNTMIGYQAGVFTTIGLRNVFLGNSAGFRQTTANDLFIVDNQARADVATELTNSILYGVMAAAPANQTLRINAEVTMPEDLIFEGGGGLIVGHMYIPGVDITVSITDNNPTEVKDDGSVSADDGWAAGELNLVTFPGGGTEHYLTVPKPGRYKVSWDMSFNMATPAANIEVHGGIMVDDVAVRNKGEGHRTIANNTDTGSMTGRAIIDCPNGTEEISLWVENTDNNADVTVEHGNVVIELDAGT